MALTKASHSFRGAAQLAYDSERAGGYLKEVCSACEAGDKAAARRALRQAINELETARAGLGIGME
jgi:DNA-binding GntR family transcriptional regulator